MTFPQTGLMLAWALLASWMPALAQEASSVCVSEDDEALSTLVRAANIVTVDAERGKTRCAASAALWSPSFVVVVEGGGNIIDK